MHYLKAKRDFIPLLFTVCTALYFLFEAFFNNYFFPIEQLAGLVMLAFCAFLFALNIRIGVLGLGLYFIIGWAGFIRLSSSNIIHSLKMGEADFVVYHAHSFMFCLMIFYLALSGKHYFGIGTARYWKELWQNFYE